MIKDGERICDVCLNFAADVRLGESTVTFEQGANMDACFVDILAALEQFEFQPCAISVIEK